MFFGSVVFFSYLHVFFFFKQKTAYEMRISDWSSDVCSSDLARHRRPAVTARQWTTGNAASRLSFPRKSWPARCDEEPPLATALGDRKSTRLELQSLMRISYAVFCLKKKNKWPLLIANTCQLLNFAALPLAAQSTQRASFEPGTTTV